MKFKPDARGKHRWSVKSSNGEIAGSSSQGFASKQKAQENAELLGDLLIAGKVSNINYELLIERTKCKVMKAAYEALQAKYSAAKAVIALTSGLVMVSAFIIALLAVIAV